MKHPFPCALAGLALATGLAAAPALAEDGHDPAQQAGAAALPRFAARSDAFELVGVLDGKRLTLYLDHAADNTPVDDATLEVEFGGRKLAVQRHGAGEFEAELAEAPGEGVIHVSARVAAGAESQQLAGELDIHGDAHADDAAGGGAGWQRLVPWALGLLSALLAAALGLSRTRIRTRIRTGTGTGRGVQL